MAKWISPMVYDRSGADITNRTTKAFFNRGDWIRIYTNSKIMSGLVSAYCGTVIPFTELSTPAANSYPAISEINTLIRNIENARIASCLPDGLTISALKYTWLAGNAATAPDYLAVNDWERDVQLIRDCLSRAQFQTVHCGVGTCGQTHFYQVQWRTWPFVLPAGSPTRRPRSGIAICGTPLKRQNLWRKYA